MTENRCYGRLIILFAIGLFCAGATTAATATVRIASWNTLHSGWQNEKHFEAVAAVMAQFDLIAVQELMEPTALARMDNALEDWTGQQWQHLASEAEGRTSYKEHYGFLWRTDRIVFTGQAVSYIDDRAAFARDPFAAVFRSKGNGRRIALATVHIRFGDSQADRRPEIRALAHYWRWLAQIYPDADLRVLAGDMNMAPDDPAWRHNVVDHAGTIRKPLRPDHRPGIFRSPKPRGHLGHFQLHRTLGLAMVRTRTRQRPFAGLPCYWRKAVPLT